VASLLIATTRHGSRSGLKFVEIFVAALAAWGYVRASFPLLFIALFGFGILGALFGPIKYGILPDHLRREQLPAGNALVEGATFVAILLGTIAGGLAARDGGDAGLFAALVMSFAIAYWMVALFIPATGAGAPHLKVAINIAASTATMVRHLRSDARLWSGAMVTSWFWLIGIVVLSLLQPLIKTLIGGNEYTVTAYLAVFSIAIGMGSGLAAAIARGRIVLKTTLVGAVLLGGFALDLALPRLTQRLRRCRKVRASCLHQRSVFAWRSICAGLQSPAACSLSPPSPRCRLGATLPMLFLSIGAATLLVALAIWKTMPKAE
jgi:predicted MFS family arabinose efflux permease